MIDIDETEKQVKLLQSKSFIRMQLDLPEVLELIERVRQAEAHRLAWAEREVLRSIERDDARDERDAAHARIAKAAKLHRPVEGIHGLLVCSHRHCVDDSQDQCAWPCETAVALGMNEGSET